MFELGDTILCDIFAGVVSKCDDTTTHCYCSDGKVHDFPTKDCLLVAGYKETLKQYEEALKRVTR